MYNLIFKGHMEYPNYIHSCLSSLCYMDISYAHDLLFIGHYLALTLPVGIYVGIALKLCATL